MGTRVEQKNEKIIERDEPGGKIKMLHNNHFKQPRRHGQTWGKRGGGGESRKEEKNKNKDGSYHEYKVKIIHLVSLAGSAVEMGLLLYCTATSQKKKKVKDEEDGGEMTTTKILKGADGGGTQFGEVWSVKRK